MGRSTAEDQDRSTAGVAHVTQGLAKQKSYITAAYGHSGVIRGVYQAAHLMQHAC